MFDKDASKVGTALGHLQVQPLEDLPGFIAAHGVHIAVVAVPAAAAQEVADMLVKNGIRAIWNFAPKDLRLPGGIIVQRTDLATSFAVLSAKYRRVSVTDDSNQAEMD